MTAKELIYFLKGCDPDSIIYIGYDGAQKIEPEELIEFKDLEGRRSVCIAEDKDFIV